jgi:hypothetical protein
VLAVSVSAPIILRPGAPGLTVTMVYATAPIANLLAVLAPVVMHQVTASALIASLGDAWGYIVAPIMSALVPTVLWWSVAAPIVIMACALVVAVQLRSATIPPKMKQQDVQCTS